MSTIRTIPPEPDNPNLTNTTNTRPSTPLPSASSPTSHTSTPTTVATLTPNGHHRASPSRDPSRPKPRQPTPLHPYQSRRQPKQPNPQDSEASMAAPQDWPEVKRAWWKRAWSWLRGWGFR
ncbi:unnamed protein product [Aureobasidium uvarum]|uniref:Uncharacterized protein n=1 Tax=Aureobasidium uvarum TaxID=2773716 RepID=A0A9N8KK43_9PEZI|nr:unnamed protein product [Aureobasidium uvarum]